MIALKYLWGDFMSIGQNIQKTRKERGLSQQVLGEMLGVSGSMIGQYENNRRNPKFETLKKIANALGIAFETLYGLSEVDAFKLFIEGGEFDLGWMAIEINEKYGVAIVEAQKIVRHCYGAFKRVDTLPSGERWDELMSGVDGIVYKENLDSLVESFSKLNSKGQEEAVRSVRIIAENPEFQKDKNTTDDK